MAKKWYVKLVDANGNTVYDSFTDETTYPPFDSEDEMHKWAEDNGYTFGKNLWAEKIEVRVVEEEGGES